MQLSGALPTGCGDLILWESQTAALAFLIKQIPRHENILGQKEQNVGPAAEAQKPG